MSVSRDTVPVALIDPDPDQPRQHFNEADLAELADSIRCNGLAVPILVRPTGDRFVIVHGERRWRAVSSLGWTDIPAEVRDLDDRAARWLQLVENINRADLSPIEEARAYRAMLDTGGETQESLAGRIGKTRTYVAQKLRLLTLPAPLTLLCDRGALSEGHLRQLLRVRGLYTDAHAFGGAPETWVDAPISELLIQGRPEDWPPGYPQIIGSAEQNPLVAEAARRWRIEIAGVLVDNGRYPYWTAPAFYFATLAVCAELSVATLNKVLDAWIERIYAAILWTRDMCLRPNPPLSDMELGVGYQHNLLLWQGHRSDLRHAGLIDRCEHLDFTTVMAAIKDGGSTAIPSECQPGAPGHDRWVEVYTKWQETAS